MRAARDVRLACAMPHAACCMPHATRRGDTQLNQLRVWIQGHMHDDMRCVGQAGLLLAHPAVWGYSSRSCHATCHAFASSSSRAAHCRGRRIRPSGSKQGRGVGAFLDVASKAFLRIPIPLPLSAI